MGSSAPKLEVVPGVPSVIDRYHLLEQIGRGGMAQVFHARQQGIGGFERDVAVKVLLPEYASESDFVDMLLDEARIAGAICHPNVSGVLDVGRTGDLFYLVMEYVDGSDLRAVVRQAPLARLPEAPTLFIIGEVLRGLHAVHTAVDRNGTPRRIVHRDVSPANVLVDRFGAVKLGDFGIAHASSRLTRTRPGSVKGKLRYMAPEQIALQAVDHRADLYAVGIMLAELLVGQQANEPKRSTPFGPVFCWSRRHAPEVSGDLANILDRATAESPAERYADAAAFRRDVSAALLRRAPGYGPEELALDLQQVRGAKGERVRHEGGELATVQQKRSGGTPSDGFVAPPLRAADAVSGEAAPPASAAVEPTRRARRSAELRRPVAGRPEEGTPPLRKVGLIAAGALATALSVGLALAIGGGATPARAPALDPVPVAVRPVSEPLAAGPALGKLFISGPPGTSVQIGSTSYPTLPCLLDLPAGSYEVHIKPLTGRPTSRWVTVEAGRDVALRL